MINLLGLIISAIFIRIFIGALNNGASDMYELIVLFGLTLVSSFSALLFASLLIGQGLRYWRDYRILSVLPGNRGRLTNQPTLDGVMADAAAKQAPVPRLPQSDFARRWGQRKCASYEETLQDSHRAGEQRPYRLRCAQINIMKSRLVGPDNRAAGYGVLRHQIWGAYRPSRNGR
jgi:hypothetical protein